MELNIPKSEMIYKAMLCVLKNDGVPFDEKHEVLWHQIVEYTDTESSDLLDLIDPFYDEIKANTQYDEFDKEKDE